MLKLIVAYLIASFSKAMQYLSSEFFLLPNNFPPVQSTTATAYMAKSETFSMPFVVSLLIKDSELLKVL